MSEPLPLADHLFRREAGRMVSALVRALGTRHLALAEDAVQDALLRALETWKFGRAPASPGAWLMRTARNRALDLLRRQGNAARLAPALAASLETEEAPAGEGPEAPGAIADDELRLMFSCCDPALPPAAQVAVVLKVLCGFSVREIAQAFLTGEATVEKQLFRARRALQAREMLFEVRDAAQARERLPAVQGAVYLLFSEGYHGGHPRQAVREDLCHEALRLGELLSRLPGSGPETEALLALLCLLASRLPARVGDDGNLLLLAEQDRARWDPALRAEGLRRLARSAEGRSLSAYHLEAAIAARHALAPGFAETDWPAIVGLYDRLLALRPGPVVELNRAIAVGMAEGPEAGLAALAAIGERERLGSYPFLPAAVAEFEARAGRLAVAAGRLREALALARNPGEEALLARKLAALGGCGDSRLENSTERGER